MRFPSCPLLSSTVECQPEDVWFEANWACFLIRGPLLSVQSNLYDFKAFSNIERTPFEIRRTSGGVYKSPGFAVPADGRQSGYTRVYTTIAGRSGGRVSELLNEEGVVTWTDSPAVSQFDAIVEWPRHLRWSRSATIARCNVHVVMLDVQSSRG